MLATKKQIALGAALIGGAGLLLGSALAIADEVSAIARQSAAWDQADVNKDGYITGDEARAAGAATSPAIDFMASDKDRDGRVSRDEYSATQILPRASDDSKNREAMERGAAGPAGPESEK